MSDYCSFKLFHEMFSSTVFTLMFVLLHLFLRTFDGAVIIVLILIVLHKVSYMAEPVVGTSLFRVVCQL